MATTSHRSSSRVLDDDSRTEKTDGELIEESVSEAPAALCLLEDEPSRKILQALTTGPMRGRDLIERCDASRPTVYRRLKRLEDAGYVTTETYFDPDGHHCKEYHLARDRLRVTITDGSITVTASSSTVAQE